MIAIRAYSVEEFADYLREYVPRARMQISVLHHTFVPAAADYRGLATIEAIRQYHRSRGWSDIGCHAYAAPDGCVYNGRPPTAANAACHYGERDPSEWPADLRELSGGDRNWPNRHGFGLEVIGNFDEEDPAQSEAMRTGLDVLAIVHQLWQIPPERCYLHRDLAKKTCPGKRVDREWVHAQIRSRLASAKADVAEWAREAVELVRARGLMVGYPDGSFGGAKPVSRQELAVILSRVLREIIPDKKDAQGS